MEGTAGTLVLDARVRQKGRHCRAGLAGGSRARSSRIADRAARSAYWLIGPCSRGIHPREVLVGPVGLYSHAMSPA